MKGSYEEVGDLYTGDKLKIDIDLTKNQIIAIIGNPRLDYGNF